MRDTERKTDERRGRKPAGKEAERQREAEGERDRNKRGNTKRDRDKEKSNSQRKKKRIKIKAETKAETSKHIQRMRMIRWKHRDYKGNQSQRGTDRQKGHRSQLEGAAQIWEDVSINTS